VSVRDRHDLSMQIKFGNEQKSGCLLAQKAMYFPTLSKPLMIIDLIYKFWMDGDKFTTYSLYFKPNDMRRLYNSANKILMFQAMLVQ
jgi:hypothetical protein